MVLNPFYSISGQYPGSKPTRGGGPRYQRFGIEFRPLFDVFGTLDRDFDLMTQGLPGVPKSPLNFFYDTFIGDIKSSMKVSGGYTVIGANPTFSADSLTQEAREDWHEANQFLGTADMSWDLNPYNYYKDGKKHLWKQVKGVWNNLASYEDLDKNYRKMLMDGFVYGIAPTGIGAGFLTDTFSRGSFRRSAHGRATDDASSLQVGGTNKGFDPVYRVEKEKKRFLYTPEQIVADPALYAKFNASGLSMDEFIAKNKGTITHETKKDVYDTYANAVVNFYTNSDNDKGRRYWDAQLRSRTFDAVGLTYAQMTEDRTAFETIARAKFGLTRQEDIDTAFVTLSGFAKKAEVYATVDAIEKNMGDMAKNLGYVFNEGANPKHMGKIAGLTKDLETNVQQAKDQMNDLAAYYATNGAPELARQFKDQAQELDNYLNNLQTDLLDPLKRGEIKYDGRISAQLMSNRVNKHKNALAGYDVLNEGVKKGFGERVLKEDLQSNLDRNNSVGFYTKDVEGVRRIMIWNQRIENEYIREAYGDLIGHFFGAKFLNTYLYAGRLKGKISSYTPSYAIREILERMHYFGLKVDENYLKDKEYKDMFIAFRPMAWMIKEGPLRNIVANRVTVDIRDKKTGKLIVDKIQTVGGDHFKMAIELGKLKEAGIIDDNMLLAMLGTDLMDPKAKNDLINLLNKTGILGESEESVKKFMGELQQLQAWLKGAGNKLGIYNPDGTLNLSRLYYFDAFLAWVKKRKAAGFDFIDLTRKYAGLMEKLTSTLNRVQSFVGTKAGKFLKPITYIKYAIAEGIADLVSGGIEGASGGLATPVALAVRKVLIGAIVRIEDKVLNGLKAVRNALFKMDFSDFWQAGIESLEKTAQKLAYISLFGCGPLVLLAGLGFMGIISTINPENPAKSPPEDISFSGQGTVVTSGGGIPTGGGSLPDGTWGTGADCPAGTTIMHPLYPSGGGNNECFHGDGYRPVDLFAAEGAPVYAPYDGDVYPYDDSVGGYTVMIFPDNDCLPAMYFAHNRQEGRAEGHVTRGTQIALMSNTGSACKPDASGTCLGAVHAHNAASTSNWFASQDLDVCVVQTYLDLVPGSRCLTSNPDYGGTPCCHRDLPNRNGCSPAANQ